MWTDKNRQRHFWVWNAMVRRCVDPKQKQFKDYGGRGIGVCEKWLAFRDFISDMGYRPSPEHTLERRDNNLGYYPENCYWATRSEQNKNRGMFKNNPTGVCGVGSVRGRWRARIRVDGKGIHLGYFDTIEAAHEARKLAMASHGFSTNHGLGRN
jgi:hypothetical protein